MFLVNIFKGFFLIFTWAFKLMYIIIAVGGSKEVTGHLNTAQKASKKFDHKAVSKTTCKFM